jgi:uncharacterized protein YdhG (YjbR/CyaY superfamily)
MPRIGLQTVDEYIASRPEAVRAVLEQARGAITRALPAAEEVISYGMPTYKLRGKAVLYLAGWKKHYSLYPITGPVIAAFSDELARYKTVYKATIRFPFSEPVPVKLIERIAKFRAREIVRQEKVNRN